MADEEKNEQAEAEETQQGGEPEAAAEEPEATEAEGGEADAAAEEAPEADADEPEAAPDEGGDVEPEPDAEPEAEPQPEAEQAEAPAADAEPAEEPTPKQRRKLERSRASGPPRPPRSPEERAAERAERRRASVAARRRYRQGRRAKRGEPGTGTPPAERRSAGRQVRQGTVVSSRAAKTITVKIEIRRRDRTYEKVVRRSSTIHAHDERDEANEGDTVRVIETRPLSRSKRWRLLEVVERAR
jgi:small subunit ribosomal protein S17